MVQGRAIRLADIRHCPSSNGGVDLVGGASRIFVERNHYNVEVGYGAGRSKETVKPIPSIGHTGIVAVIVNVGYSNR